MGIKQKVYNFLPLVIEIVIEILRRIIKKKPDEEK